MCEHDVFLLLLSEINCVYVYVYDFLKNFQLTILLYQMKKAAPLDHWIDGFFCFISICKFRSFKKLLAMIIAFLNFRIRRFIFLVQTKKSDFFELWKPWTWVRLDQIFSMRNICINSNFKLLKKFTSSSRSTKSKDILIVREVRTWGNIP